MFHHFHCLTTIYIIMKLSEIIVSSIVLTILLSCYSCKDNTELNNNQPPIAVFSFTPENADTSTVFTFNASESSDLEDHDSSLLYKWDFEGKLDWTEPVNDTIANYKYSKPGTYNVGLKVIDTQGWSDETRIDVIVEDSI